MQTNNSRIYSRTFTNGDIKTETRNNPSGLHIDIESSRFGKEGTAVTLGFDGAENRFLKLDGRQARTLFNSLRKHYEQFIYAE